MITYAVSALLLGVPPMGDALHTGRPREDRAEAMTLYGQLVGPWEGDLVDYHSAGRRGQRGGWVFGWVLEGRAIQDVRIVPARSEGRPKDLPADGNRYGTTLRVYDPASDTWQITWINPVRQVRNTLVGRRVGAEIGQGGRGHGGRAVQW